VVQKAGQITVSQAVLDRVGPGIRGDQVLIEQLKNQLVGQLDLYAITQALAVAQAVAGISSFTLAGTSGVGGFVGDLRKGKKLLTDTAGTRLRGTHAFMVDDQLDYVLAWADANGRPIANPAFDDNRLPIRSVGDQAAQGYSGVLLGGLALFGDSNIPPLGTTTQNQTIVCRCDTIMQLSSEIVPYVYPAGSTATNLDGIVGVRQYAATIPLYPSGVAAISGAGYTAATFA
jgi:hypothetical protein